MKVLAIGVLVASVLFFVGGALSARSYSDNLDDANSAPDITSVTLVEPHAGTLQIAVTVANFQALPANSWINLWFDLDLNQETGNGGDEALVRYLANDSVALYIWNGEGLVQRATAAIDASFSAGTLTLSVPRGVLGAESTFGVLAVSGRGQQDGGFELIASDSAPDSDHSAYVGPTAASSLDPANDHDAAPDVAAIRITDAKDGWVSFAISTPNLTTLASDSLVVLAIDSDHRRGTGESGVDVRVAAVGRELELSALASVVESLDIGSGSHPREAAQRGRRGDVRDSPQ